MKKTFAILCAVWSSCIAMAGPSQVARAEVQVFVRSGELEVSGPQGVRMVRTYSRAAVGETLKVPAGAAAVVRFIEGGQRYAMGGSSAAVVAKGALKRKSGPAPRSLQPIKVAVAKGPPAPTAGKTLRGGLELSPAGVIRAEDLTARWEPPLAADRFVLTIEDAAGKPLWTKSLEAGVDRYELPREMVGEGSWRLVRIEAWSGEKLAASAARLVRVLSSEEAASLGRAEALIGAALKGGELEEAESLLLRAQLYEDLGMFRDAIEMLQRTAAAQPDPALNERVRELRTKMTGDG